jgi:exodeoxyribonuclease-3
MQSTPGRGDLHLLGLFSNAGVRMDHLLLSATLPPKVRAADADREAPSWEEISYYAPTSIEASQPLHSENLQAP